MDLVTDVGVARALFTPATVSYVIRVAVSDIEVVFTTTTVQLVAIARELIGEEMVVATVAVHLVVAGCIEEFVRPGAAVEGLRVSCSGEDNHHKHHQRHHHRSLAHLLASLSPLGEEVSAAPL